MDVQIFPMNTGFIRLDQGAYITPGRGYGTKVMVPCNAFLVTDGRARVLVDTGMCETARAELHHPGSHQPEGHRIDHQLASLGVEASDIDAVIFTHLHWDHCANMKLFRRARFYVHRRELEFASRPHPLYARSYDSASLGVEPAFQGVDFEAVEGEQVYNSFIAMFPTPGHCPGHQSVAVETRAGVYVIAGDAVFADANLEPDPHRGLPFTPMGRFVDVFEMYDSMERIIRRARVVLTAHGQGAHCHPCHPPPA
jgi:N-acyl homoserine lactone hydrolase